eukprot:symbB.v1.2.040438.t1/scaffold7234.1/size12418/1
MTTGGEWDIDWSWSCSLEDFREYDPDVQIGSPRSLAACDAQGILPKELAYKPLELFQLPGGTCTMLHFLMDFLPIKMQGLDPRVAQLRYEFMEARRQDLLWAARETQTEQRAQGASLAKHRSVVERRMFIKSCSRIGKTGDHQTRALQILRPFPVALGFFKEVLDEYSVSRAHAWRIDGR